MLTERASKILDAAIQGFIDNGFPISSGWLCDHHDFGIKSAMIRSELEDLSNKGFLEQPHHSAGRIPKDRGYEFFVDRILEEEMRARDLGWAAHVFEEEAWPDLLGKLSSSLGILSAAIAPHKMYKIGLEKLLENLAWDEPRAIKEVIHDFVHLESRFVEASKALAGEEAPRVFIGKKSPLTESNELSVIIDSYGDTSERMFLVAIGPKRMNYKKAIKTFNNIHGRRRKQK